MFLVAAIAVLGISQTDAQVKFGVKAGPQLSNLVGNDDIDSESKFGIQAGAYANIRISESFAFQPEVLYSMQGAKQESTQDLGIGTYRVEDKVKLDYINVPLMVKWYAYDGLNFEFGPQVGFNVSAKAEGERRLISGEGDSQIMTSYDQDIDDVESVDFGLNIGAGYELPMGLNFGVRYGLGLTEIVKDSDVKNSVFSFGIGYSF